MKVLWINIEEKNTVDLYSICLRVWINNVRLHQDPVMDTIGKALDVQVTGLLSPLFKIFSQNLKEVGLHV